MTYQTRSCFPYDVQHFGCYFFSICFLLDRQFSLGIFTDAGMLDIYNREKARLLRRMMLCRKAMKLGPECTVDDPQALCYHVAGIDRIMFRGKFPAQYQAAPRELEVQCWYNPATKFTHFVAASGGRVIYDPIEGGSITVRDGHLDSKRIFSVI